MTTPRLEIHPERIRANAAAIAKLVHEHGGVLAGVGKVMCAHPDVLRALVAGGADMIADSRIDNLRTARELNLGVPLLLLRIPERSRVAEVVEVADISLNSSLETMRLLSDAAVAAGTVHQVVLMVDLGDLREGVWPDRALDVAQGAAELPGIELIGLGANLACYGGVFPSPANMDLLVRTRDEIAEATGLTLDLISGGNSSALDMLAAGQMPQAVNHFRMGESIILGRNVIDRSPWPGTRQDTVKLVVEVVELESKPSLPVGDRGQNAFGEEGEYVDRGIRRRAIVNLGRQDAVIEGLEPLDPGIIVLGASSDHLILDVEEAQDPVEVGSEIAFWPGYGALLALTTSPYVAKVVVGE